MLRAAIAALLALALLPAAEDLVKPAHIPVNTWVREDLFAGWVANDLDQFGRGVRKLDLYLQDHPDDSSALAWQYLVLGYRMRQALAAGDDAAYHSLLVASKEVRLKAFSTDPKDPSPYIIVGSALVRVASSAPEQDRAWMYRDGRDLLNKVPGLQKDYFDTLPPHMRGELWSQIAFASDRLGDQAERDRVLGEMVARLGGSPYEARARNWQKRANLSKEGDYACISCHEPGRLASVMTGK
jgi:hypothetical protein